MAIQFNMNALNAFSSVNFGQEDAIANLGEGNGLVQNGNRGFGVFAKIRFSSTKANNNAVRTELLKALGQAFNLQGVGEHNGRTTFSRDFMNKLEEILGPDFKRDDFGIDANGVVKSGNAEAVKDDIAYVTGIKDEPVKDKLVKEEPVNDNEEDEFRRGARAILVVQVKVPNDDFARLTQGGIRRHKRVLTA